MRKTKTLLKRKNTKWIYIFVDSIQMESKNAGNMSKETVSIDITLTLRYFNYEMIKPSL